MIVAYQRETGRIELEHRFTHEEVNSLLNERDRNHVIEARIGRRNSFLFGMLVGVGVFWAIVEGILSQ